jgi:hypothetical protein
MFWASYATIAISIAMYLSVTIAAAFTCIPFSQLWEPWLEAKCVNLKALHLSSAYFNLLLDLFIFLLPQGTVWRLNMTRSRKIGVSIIFSFGLVYV